MKFNNTKFKVTFNKHYGWPPYNKAFAETVGLPRTLLYKIHSEGNPSRDTYAIICKQMGVQMESFFTTK